MSKINRQNILMVAVLTFAFVFTATLTFGAMTFGPNLITSDGAITLTPAGNFIVGNNVNVGIGTTTPGSKLDVRGTTGLITYSGPPISNFDSESAGYLNFGNNVFSSLNDTAASSRGAGLMGVIEDNNMTVKPIIGTYGAAISTNSGPGTQGVVGLEGDAENLGSGGVASMRAIVAYLNQNGSGPVDELTGVYVTAHDHDGLGAVGINRGIYIEDQSGVAADPNNYALYSESPAGPVVLTASGSVGIGTATPTSKLQVVGLPVFANNAAAITGGLTVGAFYRTGADPDPVMVVH